MRKNWDADADYDGLVVYPKLKDVKDEIVAWRDATLTVDIEIWTTKMDDKWDDQKDQLVYQGTGTIDNWKDGSFLEGGGIQVPFEQIKVPSDEQMGWTYARIHTPDGKTYEAVDKWTLLTP